MITPIHHVLQVSKNEKLTGDNAFIMKQHSNDYLNDFATNTNLDWLEVLINEAILTNGNITDVRLEDIYSAILTGKDRGKSLNIVPQANTSSDIIQLKEMTHNSGVNALKESESIKFGSDCTVLFGLNGSGKSSYFKILNEVAGGNQQKTILPNIYAQSNCDIDVDISYQQGSAAPVIVNWKNKSRAIDPFSKIKVFDSSYLNGLLSKRQADETLVQPFGLHLFAYIIGKIDVLKNKLLDAAEAKHQQSPDIKTVNFSKEIQLIFDNHSFTDAQKRKIESCYSFTQKMTSQLELFEKEIQDLQQTNIGDKIKIENQKNVQLLALKTELSTKFRNLTDQSAATTKLLEDYQKYTKASDEHRKQIVMLNTLPDTDSQAWKDFIKVAGVYSESLEDAKETCIYCRQPLDKDALALVKAYSNYLDNDSIQNLAKTSSAIIQKITTLSALRLTLNDDEEIISILQLQKINNDSLLDLLEQAKQKFSHKKDKLKEYLENKFFTQEIVVDSVDNLAAHIQTIIDNINRNIVKLQSDDTQKSKSIQALKDKIAPLRENKAIAEQKTNLEKWFSIYQQEVSLKTKNNAIKTRHLTNLSAKAHNGLLTEKLKNKFSEELKKMDIKVNVNLENGGASKGKSSTKLTMQNTNNVTDVLSEGEQKAIALALFIAEAKMQKHDNPIVFDDPVNSLDHKIATSFAERLLELKNQVIVFTHNKLFLDAFETSKNGHVCKTINSACSKNRGKHIFLYTVQSESLYSKGIVISRKDNTARTHLYIAKQFIDESPFRKSVETSIRLRKAIECIVDEKVFNGLIPTKLSSKENRIDWNGLKNLRNDEKLIEMLKKIHNRVSGGILHNGTESEENPIEKDEFDKMLIGLNSCI